MRRIENRKNRMTGDRIHDINFRRETYKIARTDGEWGRASCGHRTACRIASSGADFHSSFVAQSVFTRGTEHETVVDS